jgi:hypothetical protein
MCKPVGTATAKLIRPDACDPPVDSMCESVVPRGTKKRDCSASTVAGQPVRRRRAEAVQLAYHRRDEHDERVALDLDARTEQ